ncbi:unnamed protein product [Angiostrongylus costaricensis]|uniref:MSP domain-containing protein n=1 Tax=Angiostrongylus costaricensis TaxID=334426 RepID=A0A0R3PDL6_ANGCS|nr:unnamed protein product [Angiostrongylus costaricensis]
MSKEKQNGTVSPVIPSARSSNQASKDEAYLLNRPNEPEHEMTMTALKVTLQCLAEKKPLQSGVRVTNPTKDKQSYQVCVR